MAAYLGLVPRERSSGEQQRRGAVTKAGDTRVRWLLVQAAWGTWRDRSRASVPLRAWAQAIATRRGKRVAAPALARRLAGLLYALWRDATDHDPQRVGRQAACPAAAAYAGRWTGRTRTITGIARRGVLGTMSARSYDLS